MRAPPPVETSCALGRAGRAALSSLVGLAAAVPVAWALPYAVAQWDAPSGASLETPQAGVILAVAVLAAGAFWLALRRRLDGGERTLRWDGQDWHLATPDGLPARRGDAALMLDLGPWMLVRFVPVAGDGPRAATWLALSIAGDAARWAALRGALWNWRAGRGDARP